MREILYIIGNGFDLAHNLPTSYYDFAKYCSKQYPKLYEQIEACLNNLNENWSNFENALGLQNFSTLKKDIERNIKMNKDYPIGIDYSDLDSAFRNWAVAINETIKTRIIQNNLLPIIPFVDGSIFLNFNYTLTLEKLYNIPQDAIIHIHICENVDEYEQKDETSFLKLIYGHALDKKEVEEQNNYHIPDEYLKREYVETVLSFHKDYQLEELKNWLKKHSNISQISILGHSMDKVDQQYFDELKEQYPKAHWWIGCHINDSNWNDYFNKKQRCNELGILNLSFFKF